MKIGITGANGFIGKNLKIAAEKAGHEIACLLDDVTYRGQAFTFVYGCDAIVHLAGLNRGLDEHILRTNIMGTFEVAEACREHEQRLIVAGSTNCQGAYGASKRLAREIVSNFNMLGLKGTYLALPRVFGPFCKPHYNSFLSTILWSAANNKPYKHLIDERSAGILQEFVHVDTVCKKFLELCQEKECFLGAASIPAPYHFSIMDVVHTIETGDTTFPWSKDILKTFEWYKQDAKATALLFSSPA